GGTLCKIGSPLLSFLLCSLCTPLQSYQKEQHHKKLLIKSSHQDVEKGGLVVKKVERYFYPAVFTYEPGQEIAVVFPDLDAATSGVDDNDALLSARELLGCVMFGLEEDGEEIPVPTPL